MSKEKIKWTSESVGLYTSPRCSPYHDWNNSGKPEYTPTERQTIVCNATQKALSELEEVGQFAYNSIVVERVCELLNVEANHPISKPSASYNVEHGILGSDVYYARRYIENQALLKSNREFAKAFGIRIGQKIGTLKLDGKLKKAAVISEMDDSYYSYLVLDCKSGNKFERYRFDRFGAMIKACNDANNGTFYEAENMVSDDEEFRVLSFA